MITINQRHSLPMGNTLLEPISPVPFNNRLAIPTLGISLGAVAALYDARIIPVAGQGPAEAAGEGISAIEWLAATGPASDGHPESSQHVRIRLASGAMCLLVATAAPNPVRAIQLVMANPLAMAVDLIRLLTEEPHSPPRGIHPTATIGDRSRMGQGICIGPYVSIGHDCSIGDNTTIHAHVTIGDQVSIGESCIIHPHCSVRERCEMGSRVVLHSGVVIGADGYGYATIDGVHKKIPQVGIVVLEDDVEIGAHSAVDRARFGRTRVGTGTKIGNLAQIGHNADIGRNTLVGHQTGIAGSARIGDGVVLENQTAIAGHLHIGDGTQVAAHSIVHKTLPPRSSVCGSPAHRVDEQLRILEAIRRFASDRDLLRRVEIRMDRLENASPPAESP